MPAKRVPNCWCLSCTSIPLSCYYCMAPTWSTYTRTRTDSEPAVTERAHCYNDACIQRLQHLNDDVKKVGRRSAL